ncbi:MAG: prolyl oligopeptidase family serine peptidase [Phycisphaerae bacterium]|nr:prolyl oligopeptidase family serine peptidase [Phycisphaerae bacterium]
MLRRTATVLGTAGLLLLAAAGGCMVPQSQNVHGNTGDIREAVSGGNYYLYLPQGYNPSRGQKYPLIVSIHGMKPFDNAYPQLMTWRKICDDNDWIAIAPQLRSPDMLNQFPFRRIDRAILEDEARIVSAIQDVRSRYAVDSRYVMLTGWSSGGYLIHYTAARHPELFTMIAPQGANFSEDIMPQYVTDAAKEIPVYIYHGSFDLPMVVKDSNAAARWYIRHGYRTVKMDEAPGGHERHPELAARFFASILRTDTAGVIAARTSGSTPGGAWLGAARPISATGTGPVGPSVAAVTPGRAAPVWTAHPAATPPALPTTAPPPVASLPTVNTPMVQPPPRERVNNTPTPSTVVTPPAPAPAVAAGPSAWDRIGPSNPSDTVRFGPPATPRTLPAASTNPPAVGENLNQTSPIGAPRVATAAPAVNATTAVNPNPPPPVNTTGAVKDTVVASTPAAGEMRAVSLPVGPAETPVKIDNSPPPLSEARLTDPERTAAKPITADSVRPTLAVAVPRGIGPANLTPSAPPPAPAADNSNPVANLKPTPIVGRSGSPAAAPQAVPAASSLLNVRILPSFQQGSAPLTVEFRAELRGITSPIVKYNWRLENSMFSTSHYGVLTFQQAGDYPIELTVTDAAGNTHRGRTIIRVTG